MPTLCYHRRPVQAFPARHQMRVLRKLTFIRSRGLQAPGAPSAAITYHDFAFSTFLVSSPNFSCLLGLLCLIFLLDLTYRRFVNCYAEGRPMSFPTFFLHQISFMGQHGWRLISWYGGVSYPLPFGYPSLLDSTFLGIGGRLSLRHLDEKTPFFLCQFYTTRYINHYYYTACVDSR